MRLDKFVCKSTELTRDEASKCIDAGNVRVNDVIVSNDAIQVHENNIITLNGVRLKTRDFRYILMHKPAATLCSNVDEAYPTLFNYLDTDRLSELHFAGRLDANTTGLVLITDDGRWSYNVTVPSKHCRKVYRVKLARDLADDVVLKFKSGVQLQGEQRLTLPATLEFIHAREVLLTLVEGKFHQVKRMFAVVGNRVVGLHREQIGDVCLDVESGRWRYLTNQEIRSFNE